VRKLVTKLAKIMNGVLLKTRDVEAQQDVVGKLMDFDLLKNPFLLIFFMPKKQKCKLKSSKTLG